MEKKKNRWQKKRQLLQAKLEALEVCKNDLPSEVVEQQRRHYTEMLEAVDEILSMQAPPPETPTIPKHDPKDAELGVKFNSCWQARYSGKLASIHGNMKDPVKEASYRQKASLHQDLLAVAVAAAHMGASPAQRRDMEARVHTRHEAAKHALALDGKAAAPEDVASVLRLRYQSCSERVQVVVQKAVDALHDHFVVSMAEVALLEPEHWDEIGLPVGVRLFLLGQAGKAQS
mmetsp:Transcript_25245/g.63385  ORF Transcript_25245/g.63385 Transcript_25245/m.63385 type:complete len:231 (+) Transcript_25245:184-876(+)|eukprot:CAMPEP_0177670944 /NCGR_PEP_ID=MMETSP0447-20121125/24390_1 /TAXON_ID=0 /ORGANISM="Stygamoeba regulata, Strain BSH-02190019" /LENGTH=230 /DNA_ID=CAMNT_0019178203 /DNA_START=31 /DNA_END=723 /DNA_ORIENTATION=-